MKDLVLKSSEWARGCTSRMQTAEGKRCCMGVLSFQEGVPEEMLLGKGTLVSIINYDMDGKIDDRIPKSIRWLVEASVSGQEVFSSIESDMLVTINDDVFTTDSEKVRLMRPIFKKHGFNVVFRSDL